MGLWASLGGIILIIGACRRAQPSMGVTVPRQVFLYSVRKLANRVGEIAQQLRALTILPDLGLVPSTHMTAHNYQ